MGPGTTLQPPQDSLLIWFMYTLQLSQVLPKTGELSTYSRDSLSILCSSSTFWPGHALASTSLLFMGASWFFLHDESSGEIIAETAKPKDPFKDAISNFRR